MIIFILEFLAFQAFVILVIVFFLRRALHNNLVESAIHEFEVMFAHDLDPSIDEVEVICCSHLKSSLQDRILQAANRKLKKTIKLSLKQDRSMKGGLVIILGTKTIDASLINRLRESGWAK